VRRRRRRASLSSRSRRKRSSPFATAVGKVMRAHPTMSLANASRRVSKIWRSR
jgi:hypothetical protein